VSVSQWIQHINVYLNNIVLFYLIVFHTSEINRKILSLLNHILLSSDQARVLAWAASEHGPAAAPATRTGMLVEPGVVPAVLEGSELLSRPAVLAHTFAKPTVETTHEEALLCLGNQPPLP